MAMIQKDNFPSTSRTLNLCAGDQNISFQRQTIISHFKDKQRGMIGKNMPTSLGKAGFKIVDHALLTKVKKMVVSSQRQGGDGE